MPRFSSDVVPDVTGRQLGEDDARFDAKIRHLNVSGSISGTFDTLAVNSIGHEVVAFTSTPTFDCADHSGFDFTLSGNVITSAIINLRPGLLVVFTLRQDATGGWTFAWPANVIGGMDLGTGPNEISTQLFYMTDTQLIALTPGNIA
jgi:hypothetical protein